MSGLDTLRVLALMLITWQHAASVLGAYETTQWRGISPGQIGVGIFCAISGYLAFQTARQSARSWLFRRLQTVFPSYWIVTVVAFGLALAFGSNKQVSIGLFVSQMLGLGFFTHGWELVNVVSWFISLILLCYVLAYLVHRSGRPLMCWCLIGAIALLLMITRTEVSLSRHVLAFTLGAAYGTRRNDAAYGLMGTVLLAIGAIYDPQLFYSGCGLTSIVLAIRGMVRDAAVFRGAAAYSYEYFLVHGILLVAATRFVHDPMVSIAVGVVTAAVAAIALSRLERCLLRRERASSEGQVS